MTWGELKRRVEELGVKDEDPIRWIDIHGEAPVEEVEAAKDKQGRVAIYT
jgi:hypothetical protein